MSGYVILVNYNGWRDTLECLETLLRSEYRDFRVVVCDNGSTDNSLERIGAWAAGTEPAQVGGRYARLAASPLDRPIPFVRYGKAAAEAGGDRDENAPLILVECGANLGFAGGNNVGLRYALARGCDWVWLLNNDTVVEPQALGNLVDRLAGTPGAGICGSTLLLYGEPSRVQALGGGWYCRWLGLAWHLGRLGRWPQRVDRDQVERRMSYPVGASMLVSADFLREVGLMCEEYFLFFEELDWVLRSRGRFRMLYAPDSVVYHKVGGAIGTSSHPGRKSLACDYWNIRNRIFFTRRWYPAALPTVYLTLAGALLTRALLGKWDRVAMIFTLMCGGWREKGAAVTLTRD
ncbi:glycosyltransferase family 2 protein [Geomonas subterranea]|uniref:Glycosyltransferase family 2 protein n=1 Tax=Geomonas subterranea TaxID=2847989 RepID=A0ABX8LS51_9BACT|nr:glycosyltransferase family 2 protein [Geomonas subterranea]QXE92340.1 glycosyltransferase family 2 protein [Geomonas subterranea]QXM09561.1 glycosyltransferase family 2 protein [Geomonas subterranea]